MNSQSTRMNDLKEAKGKLMSNMEDYVDRNAF